MTRWSSVLVFVVAVLMLAGPGRAQNQSAEGQLAETAQQLAAAGEWDDAERQLLAGLGRCRDGDAGRACRLLLGFSLGYVYEQQARADPQRRAEVLELSSEAYRRVLSEAPKHSATLNNLALVLSDRGDVGGLGELLQQARQSDPSLAATIALLIGETRAAASRWVEAHDFYVEAARLSPRDETPLRKLVQAYLEMTGTGSDRERTRAFFGLVQTWETAHPAAAQDGYRAIVRRHELAPDEAERALSRWIVLASQQRTLSAASVDEAFKGIAFSPVSELLELLAELERDGPEGFGTVADIERALNERTFGTDLRFWSGMERRHIVGLAALALGRASVVARTPGQAQRQWVLGLALAPPMEDYILGSLSEEDFLPLELITELAWLQFRYPELDPDGRKFKYFIELLFEGKAQAYGARDLRAIQRHHTVLGEIFAAKGIWESGWADNAIFQLSHAIEVAERRAAEEEGFYQPLPGLRERLAEGYLATRQKDKAAATLIDAAQAYLDTDDLDRATAMLDRARDLGTTAVSANLERVLSWRRSVQAALDNGGSIPDLQQVVRDLGSLGLPADFVARQSFKLTADLARLRSRSSTETAKDVARSAILAARQAKSLVGTADVLRLEWSANAVVGDERPVAVELNPALAPRRRRQSDWQVNLPSSDRPFSATILSEERK